MKILPELTKSVEFGGGGPRVFIVVLNIGSKLTGDEYERTLTPLIARLFASPDRAMRVCLLDNLPKMIDHLPQKMVNNSIFPQLVGRWRFNFGSVLIRTGNWFFGCGTCR